MGNVSGFGRRLHQRGDKLLGLTRAHGGANDDHALEGLDQVGQVGRQDDAAVGSANALDAQVLNVGACQGAS
ncbi:hypothetical protein D3C77_643570 [compost metagenome]